MIDWLTLKLDGSLLSPEVRQVFREKQDLIVKISPDGEKLWEIPARTSIRSDSHQVVVRLGSELEIMGSPARVMHSDNVFGSSDILECFHAMRDHVCRQLEIILPSQPEAYKVTRIDVTENYLLDSLSEVKQALNYLRHTEGGRYQVRTEAETVYWSPKSRLRSGKAYGKGPHLRYQNKKGQIEISEEKLLLADRLLRLELRLGAQYLRERANQKWYEYSPLELSELHSEYFSQFIGDVEIMENDDILEKLREITTSGQALAAFRTWSLIKSHGLEITKSISAKATWHRHKKLLKLIGVSWADFQQGELVPFRKKKIILDNPIKSWEQSGQEKRSTINN